ncbi:Uncharacterized conserved protein, phosphatidylethanolamine-binding protein (PEBP) family [Lachnospiraceae bacterium]|nr:Uncharacterized conserved protein, phosphatidylethanolamine-binding protein (PEBP) family [Lachnospiraceae bacterium]
MKKVLHKTTFISLCFVLGLLLTGCSETNAKENNDTGSTMVTTEASGENDVSDTTELSAANELPNEISDEDVLNQISSDAIQDITINSHNSESLTQCDYGTQYITRDTVNATYNAGNITGLLPQTVSKDYEFYLNKDTSEWEMLSDTITACEVDNSALPNSSWKCESIDSASAKLLFGDEIESDEKGTLYFHFLKRAGLFSFNLSNEKNTSTERFFTTVGTNGKMNWISDNANIEKSFSITDGSINDSGEVVFEISTDNNTLSINIGTDVVCISEHEYDEALGLEVDENKVYLDTLPVFEVTTASAEAGMWKDEIGLKAENVSPELTWDAVDGATRYAVLMIDETTAGKWFHWYALVDKTHLDEGEYTDIASGYAGPYPTETHQYNVYVIALRDEPSDFFYKVDAQGEDIFGRVNNLNTASDGSAGNVLAYGVIEAKYTPSEDYYGYR